MAESGSPTASLYNILDMLKAAADNGCSFSVLAQTQNIAPLLYYI